MEGDSGRQLVRIVGSVAVLPRTSYAVMAIVAIIDIGLLYAILGEYAAKA